MNSQKQNHKAEGEIEAGNHKSSLKRKKGKDHGTTGQSCGHLIDSPGTDGCLGRSTGQIMAPICGRNGRAPSIMWYRYIGADCPSFHYG